MAANDLEIREHLPGVAGYAFLAQATGALGTSSGLFRDSLAGGIVCQLVIFGPAALYIWLSGFWRLWRIWKPLGLPTRSLWIGALLATVFLTMAASSITSLLVAQGVLEPSASYPEGGEGIFEGGFVALEEYYFWNFTAMVPLLEIPETLSWSEPELISGPGSGAILLSYKVLVVLPVLTVLTSLFSHPEAEGQAKNPDESPT